MNKITALLGASALIASSTFAYAGGPIVVMEEAAPVVAIQAGSPSSGNIGPAVGLGVALLVACALACGGSSDGDTNTNTNTNTN